MTLTHMPGNMPRLGALNTMLKIDEGKIDQVHNLSEESITAFVFEPLEEGKRVVLTKNCNWCLFQSMIK